MINSKLPRQKKKDKEWQEKIAKNLEKEKSQLDHPRLQVLQTQARRVPQRQLLQVAQRVRQTPPLIHNLQR